MRTESTYEIPCVCGRLVSSHEPQTTCPNCKAELTVEWQPLAKKELSNCCGGQLSVQSSSRGPDSTNYYVCQLCGKAADPKQNLIQPQLFETKPEAF